MAAPATVDTREQLWIASFETYYKVFFEEKMADRLIDSLSRLDDITKILVALTASGSAIAGWALWNKTEWKVGWIALSGVAALLSVVHTSLAVPDRIKKHADDKRRFSQLRINLETFRYRLEAEDFDANKFNSEFMDFRRTFGEHFGLLTTDTFRTRKFEMKVQEQLDQQLGNDIERKDKE